MMGLKMETTKKFKHYGEKIKQISFHKDQPLIIAARYDGKLIIFNYESQTVAKMIEVSDSPLRTAIWISDDRIACSGDDKMIRVYNFHTTQKLMEFEGHQDFVRKLIFNQTTKDFLSCSDDKSIIHYKYSESKQNYEKFQEWKEHSHFVMDIKWNPKEEGVFASASLDWSIKLWNVKSKSSNGTLKGHSNGVNCLSFYQGDRALLLSGGDDFTVIVWDLTSRSMVRKLKNHEGNVTDVCFMEKLPIFSSLSEDGKLNFYSLKNFEFCFDIINFMNKGWSLSTKQNLMASCFDEGCVVSQIGNDKPLSSSLKGKIIWSSNSEVFGANLKAVVTKYIKDFEPLDINYKEFGNLDIFPKKVQHNSTGQLVCFCDGSEYVIYKALSFKLVLFGAANEFVWGPGNKFAILDKMNEIQISLSTGQAQKTLKFDFYISEIFGGQFLGIATTEFILFYDWEGENCIGKIDVEINDIYWNKDKFVLKGKNQFFFLEYNPSENEQPEEDENVFNLYCDFNEQIYSGFWLNEIFFFTDESNKFKLLICDKTFLVCNLKDNKLIMDYLKNHQKFFFFDKAGKITTYAFSSKLLKLIQDSRQNFLSESHMEDLITPALKLSDKERDFISKILIAFGKKETAFKIIVNLRNKFDLAIELGYLKETIEFCENLGEAIYWKKLGDLALVTGDFDIAEKAFWSCEDMNSLLLLYSCLGDRENLLKVAEFSEKQKHYSVSFMAYWTCKEVEKCFQILLISEKFGQAAIFAKNYIPSKIDSVYKLWKDFLKSSNQNLLFKKLANPLEYQDQYPELKFLIEIEEVVEKNFRNKVLPAQTFSSYSLYLNNLDFYSYAKANGIQELENHLRSFVSNLDDPNFDFSRNTTQIKEKPSEPIPDQNEAQKNEPQSIEIIPNDPEGELEVQDEESEPNN